MKTRLIIFLFICLGISACHKKSTDIKGDSIFDQFTWINPPQCQPPNSGFSVGPVEGKNYRYPVFNPNNQIEFIYYSYLYDSISHTSSDLKLVKYNMKTHVKQVLLSNVTPAGPVAWNKKGQVAFINADNFNKIYVMNDDGSNLETYNVPHIKLPYVKWSNDGKSIYWVHSHIISSTEKEDYLMKNNIVDEKTDTILSQHPIYSMAITPYHQLINYEGNGYYEKISLAENPVTPVEYKVGHGFLMDGLSSNKNGTKIFGTFINQTGTGATDIRAINIYTHSIETIFNGCSDRYVRYIDASLTGKYLLMEQLGATGDKHPYEIWLLDLETHKEALVIGEL